MHLLELASANRALLRHMLQETHLEGRVKLHDFAASNETSSLQVVKGLYAGDERGSALTGKKARKYAAYSSQEKAVALDDFIKAQQLGSLYHVAIDTEGWDALVVEGMRTTLSKKQVSILEFEVNDAGMWSHKTAGRDARTVQGTLQLLQAAGYACFWVLTQSLVPASGECWLADFGGPPKWSNMLCAYEPPVLAVLDAIAQEGYAARHGNRTRLL